MAQTVTLSATLRDQTGKGAARQARFQKQVPAVIYGHGRTTQTLTGYFGGVIDDLISRIIDILLAFPFLSRSRSR